MNLFWNLDPGNQVLVILAVIALAADRITVLCEWIEHRRANARLSTAPTVTGQQCPARSPAGQMPVDNLVIGQPAPHQTARNEARRPRGPSSLPHGAPCMPAPY